MSGLPNQFPQQSVPFGQTTDGEDVFIDINWFLLLYNVWLNVLSAGSGGGGTPASPYDSLDAANLFAETSDIPQAFRQIASLQVQLGVTALLPDPAPAAQPAKAITVGASPFVYAALSNGVLSVTGGAVSAVSIIRQGVSVATGITTSNLGVIESLTDEKGSGGGYGFVAGVDYTAGTSTTLTLSQNYASAANLWVAFDGAEQARDSYSLSGTTLTFTSPIPVGPAKVYVKGALPAAVSASGGLVPLRRLDEVQITYTSAPTVVFLPS